MFLCFQVSSHCEEIVKLGGLQLLMRVYQARERSPKILSHIAQIIANLAEHQSLRSKIIQAGKKEKNFERKPICSLQGNYVMLHSGICN